MFLMFCESDAKSYGCDIFLCTCVMCYCVITASAYTFAGPLSLKQNGVYTLVITSGCADCPLRTLPTLIADLSYFSFHCSTTSGFVRIVQQQNGSICDRVIHPFSCDCGAMASSAVSSMKNMRDAAGNHAETFAGAYIYYGDAASFHEWHFALDFTLLVKLVMNTSKRCPKSVMDCVVTHSARHKKLASIICEMTEDRVVSTRRFVKSGEWFSL